MCYILRKSRRHRTRKQRRVWVRDIFKNREQQGCYNNLIQEMRLGDREYHFRFVYFFIETIAKLLSLHSSDTCFTFYSGICGCRRIDLIIF